MIATQYMSALNLEGAKSMESPKQKLNSASQFWKHLSTEINRCRNQHRGARSQRHWRAVARPIGENRG